MIFITDTGVKIVLFALSVAGFFVAKHIRHHKKNDKPLVCPMKMKCDVVVHSDYSKFLGLPVELLGMFYYAVISLYYVLVIIKPDYLSALPLSLPILFALQFLPLILASAAFLFSLYLISVQIFVIKEGCFWCFVSGIISTLMFIIIIF